jgi:DNA-binding MarR family transcriptional regulator
MGSVIVNTTRIDAQLLKQLSRMYEAGIPLNDISEELKIEQKIVKKLLKLLGYASAD